MESITPHYVSLGLLKFLILLNWTHVCFFMIISTMKSFLPVSLVSELHNYSTRSASSNQVVIPSFRTNLRRFCPSIIGSFFWNDIPQFIWDKPTKKMFRKALSRWYLAQCKCYLICFITYWAILSFYLHFFIKNLKNLRFMIIYKSLFRPVFPPEYRKPHLRQPQTSKFSRGPYPPDPPRLACPFGPRFNLHRMLCFIGHLCKLLLITLIGHRDHKHQETAPWRPYCTLTNHC